MYSLEASAKKEGEIDAKLTTPPKGIRPESKLINEVFPANYPNRIVPPGNSR